jgi:hypothetical protein
MGSMALTVRPARASDAEAVGNLAKQFAGYLRSLGDPTEFKLTAEALAGWLQFSARLRWIGGGR